METVYLVCAALGGTLMIGQFVLGALGLGGHHDVDGGHDVHGLDAHDTHAGAHDGHAEAHHDGSHAATSWFLGVLTFRTIVAALTFFGLAGMAALSQELPQPQALGLATLAGLGALVLVAYLMRALYHLRAEGTTHIDRAVGLPGTVYLKVPGNRAGAGKVQLNLQNRTVEYKAVTSQDELPTGAKIVVVAVVNSDTVEIAPFEALHKGV